MIESGGGTVYEAIVRRKSRAAIWRAIGHGDTARDRGAAGLTGRLTRHPAEISACPPREFRNLGTAFAPPFPQMKQIPYESTICKQTN